MGNIDHHRNRCRRTGVRRHGHIGEPGLRHHDATGVERLRQQRVSAVDVRDPARGPGAVVVDASSNQAAIDVELHALHQTRGAAGRGAQRHRHTRIQGRAVGRTAQRNGRRAARLNVEQVPRRVKRDRALAHPRDHCIRGGTRCHVGLDGREAVDSRIWAGRYPGAAVVETERHVVVRTGPAAQLGAHEDLCRRDPLIVVRRRGQADAQAAWHRAVVCLAGQHDLGCGAAGGGLRLHIQRRPGRNAACHCRARRVQVDAEVVRRARRMAGRLHREVIRFRRHVRAAAEDDDTAGAGRIGEQRIAQGFRGAILAYPANQARHLVGAGANAGDLAEHGVIGHIDRHIGRRRTEAAARRLLHPPLEMVGAGLDRRVGVDGEGVRAIGCNATRQRHPVGGGPRRVALRLRDQSVTGSRRPRGGPGVLDGDGRTERRTRADRDRHALARRQRIIDAGINGDVREGRKLAHLPRTVHGANPQQIAAGRQRHGIVNAASREALDQGIRVVKVNVCHRQAAGSHGRRDDRHIRQRSGHINIAVVGRRREGRHRPRRQAGRHCRDGRLLHHRLAAQAAGRPDTGARMANPAFLGRSTQRSGTHRRDIGNAGHAAIGRAAVIENRGGIRRRPLDRIGLAGDQVRRRGAFDQQRWNQGRQHRKARRGARCARPIEVVVGEQGE